MKKRKGIILAGGYGTRLRPSTFATSKHLMHVYDKPMIYYPLSILMLAGIRELLIISTPQDIESYQRLLGDGEAWGLDISYLIQNEPAGIAEVFILAKNFIGQNIVSLILGDNILYGDGLPAILHSVSAQVEGATLFGYKVKDPSRYGIINFNAEGKALEIEEKPKNPRSNYAVIGLYFYDNDVIEFAKDLKPSARGELEITDINIKYLQANRLHVHILGRGMAWLDAGTPKSLLDAANFFHSLEDRQGLKVCCPEEIAWRQQYIDNHQLEKLAAKMGENDYGHYLSSLLKNPDFTSPAFHHLSKAEII